MTRWAGLPVLLLVAAAPAVAQDLSPRIDSIFAPWNRTDAPGCAAGVRLDGTTVHLKAYGMANLEYGVPLGPESVSESGSVAKQFTAAAVALLAHQGRLSLDDDLRKYLPEVPDFGQTITLRHLMHHVSGLRDQWALLGIMGNPPGRQVHTLELIVDLISRQRMLNFAPGTDYLYSNTGFSLLAVVVQRVSGQSLPQFTADQFFRPLGMQHTSWRDDYRRVVPGRATAYQRGPAGWLQDMPFTNVYGNGGLLTTVGDLLIWNDALTAGRIAGGAELVRELETTTVLADGSPVNYALGLTVDDYKGVREVSHGGATAGYRTFLARWPDRGLSVAILCNAANANPAADAHRIADLVLDLPAVESPPGPVVTVETSTLSQLEGRYRDSVTDDIMTFTVRDGKLMAQRGPQGVGLTALGDMRFWSAATGPFTFARSGTGWRAVRQSNGRHVFEREPVVDAGEVRLEDYVGSYRSDELDLSLDLAVQDGRLMARLGHQPPVRLVVSYPDGFSLPGGTLRFLRDAHAAVTGVRIFAGRARDVRFVRLSGHPTPQGSP